jgi:hypothetical protein
MKILKRCADVSENFGVVVNRKLQYYSSSRIGGRDRDRTCDLIHAMDALSQLSYTPIEIGSVGGNNYFILQGSIFNRN